jgi:hypothetical protein
MHSSMNIKSLQSINETMEIVMRIMKSSEIWWPYIEK